METSRYAYDAATTQSAAMDVEWYIVPYLQTLASLTERSGDSKAALKISGHAEALNVALAHCKNGNSDRPLKRVLRSALSELSGLGLYIFKNCLDVLNSLIGSIRLVLVPAYAHSIGDRFFIPAPLALSPQTLPIKYQAKSLTAASMAPPCTQLFAGTQDTPLPTV